MRVNEAFIHRWATSLIKSTASPLRPHLSQKLSAHGIHVALCHISADGPEHAMHMLWKTASLQYQISWFPHPPISDGKECAPICTMWMSVLTYVLMTGAEELFEMPLCYWHFCSQLGAHHTPCPLRTTGTGRTRHASVCAGGFDTAKCGASSTWCFYNWKIIYWDTCFHFDVAFVAHTCFWWQDPWVCAVRHFSSSRIKCIKIEKVKFGIMDLCVHLILYTPQSLQCVFLCVCWNEVVLYLQCSSQMAWGRHDAINIWNRMRVAHQVGH